MKIDPIKLSDESSETETVELRKSEVWYVKVTTARLIISGPIEQDHLQAYALVWSVSVQIAVGNLSGVN